jgi:ferric-dicitrate binding protein FerR (iron transport regulator)
VNEESRTDERDDTDLAALLAAAGARSRATPEAMASVRAAVESEWRATVAARQRRRPFNGWAAAAGVAVAAVAVWIARPTYPPADAVVASVTRVVGEVQQDSGDGRWSAIGASGPVTAGTRLRTGEGGRVALRLTDGVELRLDAGTLVALEDAEHASLSQGAVYVDSRSESGATGAAFELETPAGKVRHLGTQYQARLAGDGLRVAVREGRVQVGTSTGAVQGAAGEQLVIGSAGIERSALAPNAADWAWLAAVTPPFTLEGRSVEDFLAWAARETGRVVVFASHEAAERARAVTLSGTVEGLSPDEAVAAVLSTTTLRAQIETGRIRVESVAP